MTPRDVHPLKQLSRDGILAFWAEELGVNVPELQSPHLGVTITNNSTNPGITVFRRDNDVRISASRAKIERMRDELRHTKTSDFCLPEFWRTAFPDISGTMNGPTLYYYVDSVPKTWTLPPTSRSLLLVRGLAASDLKICAALAQALPREERESSGFDTLGRYAWGVFARGKLVAFAGYDAWPNRVAHIGIATHPEHRGSKFGQLAAQAAIRGAVSRRRIGQFCCLANNAPAVGLAKALGLTCFAEALYIHHRE